MKVLVAGGGGFIESAAYRRLVAMEGWSVVNVDKLTCQGELREDLGWRRVERLETGLRWTGEGPCNAAMGGGSLRERYVGEQLGR